MKNINNPFSFFRSGHQQLIFSLILQPIITLTTSIPVSSDMNLFPNISLPTVEIIKNNGYEAEIHTVITDDGYILELHRIPKSKSGQKPSKNYPVFLHHGILGSSADWVLGGANISLPMQLADAGYDVWMTNCRGNTYSRKHVSLNYNQKAFWNFNLHEIGTYDLPAAFDYVLNETKTSQFHYIGYSMGTCVFYIMASERPEYQSKIRSQISLAPVAYLSNTRSSLKYIAPYAKFLNMIYQRMSKGMFMPQSRFLRVLASTICREKITQKLICQKFIIFSVCGSDPQYFDSNLIPIIMGHFPAGTSSYLATHFAQFILKGVFGQYDYGPTINMQRYNSTEPPTYNLKSIQVPITLIYGENDLISDVKDVMKLKAELPKVMDTIQVENVYCNHVDFLWGVNVTNQINNPVIEILQKTDAIDWKYLGPNPSNSNEVENKIHKQKKISIENLSNPINNISFVPTLDYIAKNIDAIIADTMPRIMYEKDVAEFERERENQKILFSNLIQFLKSIEKRYGQLEVDISNEISDWTEIVATNVMKGVSDARNLVEIHAKKTSILINNKFTSAGKSINYGLAKAENSVVITENFVVSSIANAEQSVNSLVKAEQSAVSGILKANSFVNYGIKKTNDNGNALNTTLRSFNKAFWFFK